MIIHATMWILYLTSDHLEAEIMGLKSLHSSTYFEPVEQSSAFLSLQKNSIVHAVRHSEGHPSNTYRPYYYQKPKGICQHYSEDLPLMWSDRMTFSQQWRNRIEQTVQSMDLTIRRIQNQDTPAIKEFLYKRYPRRQAEEVCAFDLYRFRKFGHGIVLESPNQEVHGTIFEVGYHTPEHTSYTIRLAISDEIRGHNMGYHVMIYSSLLAMDAGSKIKRGIIQHHNLSSLHINLNKVGWICDNFVEVEGLGHFFEIVLPLSPRGLVQNRIDFGKVAQFITAKAAGTDYRMIDPMDVPQLKEMYQETDFKVVALIKPGMLGPQYDGKLLAIPAAHLQMPVQAPTFSS